MHMHMQQMRTAAAAGGGGGGTISPSASSPLTNMLASPAGVGAGNSGTNIGKPAGMPMGYRPTIGMGGLGMLLMNSKRSTQGGVGTGLTDFASRDADGETAVAEGIGGMDVKSPTDDAEEGDHKMVFD